MRLFIAVNLINDDTLIEYINILKIASSSGNFTRPENLHLTLAFIGETKNHLKVKEILKNLKVKKFTFKFSGIGKFSKPNGDIYFAAVENNNALSSLVKQLTEKLNQNDFKIENRAFKPHITLARKVNVNNNTVDNFPEKEISVEKISLMKSETINGQLKYTEIYYKLLD